MMTAMCAGLVRASRFESRLDQFFSVWFFFLSNLASPTEKRFDVSIRKDVFRLEDFFLSLLRIDIFWNLLTTLAELANWYRKKLFINFWNWAKFLTTNNKFGSKLSYFPYQVNFYSQILIKLLPSYTVCKFSRFLEKLQMFVLLVWRNN